MEESEVQTASVEPPRGTSAPRALGSRCLPLNSRRLTADWIQAIAKALELPTAASQEDLRQMVDGKLSDLGKVPLNVQVVLLGEHETEHIQLQNEEGVFLEVPVTSNEQEGEDPSREADPGEDTQGFQSEYESEQGSGEQQNPEEMQEALHLAQRRHEELEAELEAQEQAYQSLKLVLELERTRTQALEEEKAHPGGDEFS